MFGIIIVKDVLELVSSQWSAINAINPRFSRYCYDHRLRSGAVDSTVDLQQKCPGFKSQPRAFLRGVYVETSNLRRNKAMKWRYPNIKVIQEPDFLNHISKVKCSHVSHNSDLNSPVQFPFDPAWTFMRSNI